MPVRLPDEVAALDLLQHFPTVAAAVPQGIPIPTPPALITELHHLVKTAADARVPDDVQGVLLQLLSHVMALNRKNPRFHFMSACMRFR